MKPVIPKPRVETTHTAGTSASASPDVSGPGNESCSKVTGTVNFDPPLVNGATSTSEMALVHLTISDCTASGGAATPTKGNAALELPLATNDCTKVATTSTVPTSIAVAWSPSTVGVSQVNFSGFTPTESTDTSFRLGSSSSTSTHAQFTLSKTTAQLKAACASAAGLASVGLTTGSTYTPLGQSTASA